MLKVTPVDEVFRMLGVCWAESDLDSKAIRCFLAAHEADPYNLPVLILLSTSYVNELNYESALKCLQDWVRHHPAYEHLLDEVYQQPDEYSDGTFMSSVVQLLMLVSSTQMLNGSGESAAGEEMEEFVTIQSMLGVLYNVTQDFDAARMHFKRALEHNPNDYCLWNKVSMCICKTSVWLDSVWLCVLLQALCCPLLLMRVFVGYL